MGSCCALGLNGAATIRKCFFFYHQKIALFGNVGSCEFVRHVNGEDWWNEALVFPVPKGMCEGFQGGNCGAFKIRALYNCTIFVPVICVWVLMENRLWMKADSKPLPCFPVQNPNLAWWTLHGIWKCGVWNMSA